MARKARNLEELARRYGVSPEELRSLCGVAPGTPPPPQPAAPAGTPCLRCLSCGHKHAGGRDGTKYLGRKTEVKCAECSSVHFYDVATVKCARCEGYVPFGTRLCECGYKRVLTASEAKAAGFKVSSDPWRPRQCSSAGRKKDGVDQALGRARMVHDYRMDSGDKDEE